MLEEIKNDNNNKNTDSPKIDMSKVLEDNL